MTARPPWWAKIRAVARPMPRGEAAPVTMQIFSDRSMPPHSGENAGWIRADIDQLYSACRLVQRLPAQVSARQVAHRPVPSKGQRLLTRFFFKHIIWVAAAITNAVFAST